MPDDMPSAPSPRNPGAATQVAPRNATLLSGELAGVNRPNAANQANPEIGDPEEEANPEIGDPDEEANREIGVPGEGANREIGVPGEGANRESGGPEEEANPEIGGPGVGWHSRGYLPHCDVHGLLQHVTFHLADSLPTTVLEQFDAQLKMLPAGKREIERRKRIEAWIDAGHGSCILRNPAVSEMVQNSLAFFHGSRYRLLVWVIMPNHVHALFEPINGWTVAKIVASWKKFTATQICAFRRASSGRNAARNANLPIGKISDANQVGTANSANREIGVPDEEANREIGVPEGEANREIGVPTADPPPDQQPVWHREYWDRYIRDEEHLQEVVDYIHRNPVKARLVARAEDWPWSSARHFAWNANLMSGEALSGNQTKTANQEIGDPEEAANREIGVPEEAANREIGVPEGEANREIGVLDEDCRARQLSGNSG
jgi:REP element-mobilizing transposase RayT